MDEVNPMINEDAGTEQAGVEETPQLRAEAPAFDPTAVITTKRRVQVKLTGDKMMDPERGLPHLMKIGKKRLHISKNKSSYENLSNIVQVYQLWAHQLYPKAKFNDFIKLSQQLGRSDKILREYRKKVIRQELGLEMVGEEDVGHISSEHNDTQPTSASTNDNNNTNNNNSSNAGENIDDEIISRSNRRNVFVPEDDSDDDNLYSFANSTAKPVDTGTSDNDIDEEIERLEAEQLLNTGMATIVPEEDHIEEDEDAMEAMREDTPAQQKDKQTDTSSPQLTATVATTTEEENVATTATTPTTSAMTATEDEIRKLEEELLTNPVVIHSTKKENKSDEEFEDDEDAMDVIREDAELERYERDERDNFSYY